MQKSLKVFVASAMLAGGGVASAVPFNSFDPRSMAMGGTGVAVGDPTMAPFFNPALLSVARDRDHFSLSIPVGARVYGRDVITDVNDFNNNHYVDALQNAIDAFNVTPSTDLTTISNDTRTLSAQLAKLSDRPIEGEAGGGLVIGIPGKSYGGAFYASGWGAAGGVFTYRDKQTLDGLAAAADKVTACAGNTTCLSALGTDPTVTPYVDLSNPAAPKLKFSTNTLQSTLDIRAVAMGEMGLALSKQIGNDDNPWALGITPKAVKIKLYEYSANAQNAKVGDVTASDNLAEYSNVNFDVGLAKNYGDGWRTGFVVKNVIPHTYDFKRAPTPGATPVATGDTIKLNPQARMGFSHATSWSTVAMDLDLTANEPAGLENKSQYLSLGGELNAADWAQLRLGYRANLKDSKRNVPSIGLGLAPFGTFHFDVAVTKSANEIGGSARLALTF